MNIQDMVSTSALIKEELGPIAQKIGEGAEWTYAIFVKQAYANAIFNLLLIVPGVLLLVAASKVFRVGKKLREESKYNYWEGYYALSIGILVLALFFILLPIVNLIQVLINPDYAAIKLIIYTLGSTN